MTARRALATCAVLFAATAAVQANPIKPADIDLPACKSVKECEVLATRPGVVLAALGLGKPQREGWHGSRHLIVLKREIALGSIFVPGSRDVFILKPGANPDPLKDSEWTALTCPPRQSSGGLFTLNPDATAKAILIVDRETQSRELRDARLFAERFHNITPASLAYADREYLPPMGQYIPNPASNIPSGRGHWVNVGKDDRGFIPAPPVSDLNPSWFLLSWQQEQSISGLWLDSNVQKLDVETFDGPATVNPRAATPAEWKRMRDWKEDGSRFVSFVKPIRTRGLKLTFLKTDNGPVAQVNGLHVFTDLGQQAVPPPPIAADEPPPFKVPYCLKDDGNLTLAVNRPDGTRARNLITRIPTTKGEHELTWDLKDEDGNFVEPGKYRWTAISGPELRLKYEMTVYPDVSRHAPVNSPWINALHDSGGWMADHTPPISGCAAGDNVYLGSMVAESGISLIECDLEGRKRWGHHSFAAWTGAQFLASNEKEVFVGSTILGSQTDAVWGVDLKTKKIREILMLKPSATRRRGLQGIAARGDTLFLSVRANASWMEGAAAAEDADLLNCLPLYPEQRKPRVANEFVPNPRGDFVRLFRLTSQPPGGGMSKELEYLETEGGKKARQHIVLAFHRPVPLGSVVYPVPHEKDIRVVLSILKPTAAYPPNAEREADWIPFASSGSHPWEAVPAPEGTQTRALRITFVKGKVEKDPLADLIDKKGPDDALDFGKDTTTWRGRLEGMKLLRRRFVNVMPDDIRVNSGKVEKDGSWDARRTAPLSTRDPGIYTMEWKTAQSLRGLAIKEIDGQLTKIDVWTGAESGDIDIKARDGWKEIATYEQQRRDVANGYGGLGVNNPAARYVDGYVDFGREVKTRAIRLRVIKQWADKGQSACLGIRIDLGGGTIDLKRCRVWGVAALKYVGGEAPVDTTAFERIEVYDTTSSKLVRTLAMDQPGGIAMNPAGELFVLSGNGIIHDDKKPFIADLQKPTCLTFDRKGRCYVYDGGEERQNVRVYDETGKYLRTIGLTGGIKAGPWEPQRIGAVSALAVDTQDQLWMVESQYYPKRITVWTTEGKFVKELLGNTPYGGGGVLDPLDKARLFYGPLEFELDWKTGLSRIKNMTWTGSTPAGEVPIKVGGRTYVVTRPLFAEQQCAIVYLHEHNKLKLAAAMGMAEHFEPLKDPELLAKFGGKTLTTHRFLWIDRNGDGIVQAEEVELKPRGDGMTGLTHFNDDLGIQAGRLRYQVKEFLPSGVPVYEEKEYPALAGRVLYRLNEGGFFRMGMGKERQAVLSPEGKPLWTFPQEGDGVQALHNAKPWRPDQVVAQFGIVGHAVVESGLGEVVVLHGNSGAWNVWTHDGLLAGPIFRDLRNGARPWSMKEHARGLMPEGLTAGEEHFAGYFCRAGDKNYVVAGHNHISILEVVGLDKYERLGGEIAVTADDVRKAKEWESQRQKEQLYVRSPVIDAYRVKSIPAFDGKLGGWGAPDAYLPEGAAFRIGYDDQYLYLAWDVNNLGPLKNTGRDWQRLFKSGAAVDLHLATDPSAKPDRQAPEAGDIRLLLTFGDKKPMAVLYRPVVPGTPADKAFRVVSPVGETIIDRVEQLSGVKLVRGGLDNRYTLEAAIPLAAIGLKPLPGLRLKMDWGVLVSGPDGTEVIRRVYWANRAWQIVADAPSEARLHPHLWGHVVFHGIKPGADDKLTDVTQPDKGPGKVDKKDINDILDDLKTRPPKKP
jgi:hypothetical protein